MMNLAINRPGALLQSGAQARLDMSQRRLSKVMTILNGRADATARMRFELRSKEELTYEPLITLRPRGGVIGRVTARA